MRESSPALWKELAWRWESQRAAAESSHEVVGAPGAVPLVFGLAGPRDIPALVRFYHGLSEVAFHAYHPFPRNRLALAAIYSTLVLWQAGFRWLMRRSPRLIRCISIARVEGTRRVVGTCTIRGEWVPDRGWCVRIGQVVADGHRGQHIGRRNLQAVSEVAVGLGIRWQIGSFFTANTALRHMMASLGAEIGTTDLRDPMFPSEPRSTTLLDMHEFVQRPLET